MKPFFLIPYFIFFLINCDEQSFTKPEHKQQFGAANIFQFSDSIKVKGNRLNPLTSITSITEVGDSLFIADELTNTIYVVFNNEIISSFGGKGRGPGEFEGLDWIGLNEDTIYARNGKGEFKYETFDKKGNYIRTIPLPSYAPYTETYFINRDGNNLIHTTGLQQCNRNTSDLCSILHSDVKGNVVASFAPIDEVEKDQIGVPFLSGYSAEKEVISVAHVHGTAITHYSIDGYKLNVLDITKSEFTSPLDKNEVPKNNVSAEVEFLRTASNTTISKIIYDSDRLVIQYMRRGEKFNGMADFFFDIYDLNGNMQQTGVDFQYFVLKYENGNYFFVKKEEGDEYDTFTIYKARLKS